MSDIPDIFDQMRSIKKDINWMRAAVQVKPALLIRKPQPFQCSNVGGCLIAHNGSNLQTSRTQLCNARCDELGQLLCCNSVVRKKIPQRLFPFRRQSSDHEDESMGCHLSIFCIANELVISFVVCQRSLQGHFIKHKRTLSVCCTGQFIRSKFCNFHQVVTETRMDSTNTVLDKVQ